MNGPRLFDFVSFVPVGSRFPSAAQHLTDGPTKDVTQSHQCLQTLSATRWLCGRPKPPSRAGPLYMALMAGPFDHTAWVQIPAETSPTSSTPLNSSTRLHFQNPAPRIQDVPSFAHLQYPGLHLLRLVDRSSIHRAQ